MVFSNRRSDPGWLALLGAGYVPTFTSLRPLPHVEVRAICDVNRGRRNSSLKGKGIPADLSKMLSLRTAGRCPSLHHPIFIRNWLPRLLGWR